MASSSMGLAAAIAFEMMPVMLPVIAELSMNSIVFDTGTVRIVVATCHAERQNPGTSDIHLHLCIYCLLGA